MICKLIWLSNTSHNHSAYVIHNYRVFWQSAIVVSLKTFLQLEDTFILMNGCKRWGSFVTVCTLFLNSLHSTFHLWLDTRKKDEKSSWGLFSWFFFLSESFIETLTKMMKWKLWLRCQRRNPPSKATKKVLVKIIA